MFQILSATLRTALKSSAPKHQRLSHEEWQHRFLPRQHSKPKLEAYRFDRNRDFGRVRKNFNRV